MAPVGLSSKGFGPSTAASSSQGLVYRSRLHLLRPIDELGSGEIR